MSGNCKHDYIPVELSASEDKIHFYATVICKKCYGHRVYYSRRIS